MIDSRRIIVNLSNGVVIHFVKIMDLSSYSVILDTIPHI